MYGKVCISEVKKVSVSSLFRKNKVNLQSSLLETYIVLDFFANCFDLNTAWFLKRKFSQKNGCKFYVIKIYYISLQRVMTACR